MDKTVSDAVARLENPEQFEPQPLSRREGRCGKITMSKVIVKASFGLS